ncbi:ERI1 exoribonuclease 2 [Hoplias malabaricus]|uniref:ERI1 exoribonuclease 2 n=1 Tax=Hoplias malabaricus TaxID=27720 RepID=UPI00346366D0
MSTKELARELGLIRRRGHSSSAQKKQVVLNQLFSYLIIIDFESTCWREKNNYGQEIIEFPAVLLNTSSGEIESEFHSYVQPQEHPVLSGFCTELTGITQAQVEAGLPLRICLSRFSRWLLTLQQEKGVVCVTDSKVMPPSPHLCTFLTWSDWDLGVCLLYECKRKQISKPDALSTWIDLRATYRTFYGRKPKGLNGALQDLGIQFSGREHSGLDDARNTARLAWRMMMDGCVLKVTKSLSRTPVKSRPVCVRSKTNTHSSAEEKQTSTHSGNHGNVTPNTHTSTSVCKSLVTTRTVLSSLTSAVCVSKPQLHTTLPNNTHTLTFDPETEDFNWSEDVLVPEETGGSGSYDDVPLEEFVAADAFTTRPCPPEPHISKPCPSTPAPIPLLLHTFFTCQGHTSKNTSPSKQLTIYTDQSDHSSVSFKVPPSVLSSSTNQSARPSHSRSVSQLKSSSIFVNQSSPTFCSNNQSKISNSHKSASSFCFGDQSKRSSTYINQSALSSISINQSAPQTRINQSDTFCSTNQSKLSSSSARHPSSVSKVTAPLCECGRRAKRLTVCNGGPNQGRAFYTCPIRRSSGSGPAHRGGCGFFKWESAVINSTLKLNRRISFSVTTSASRNFR